VTALRQWCVAHRPFVVALALGAAVRVVASLAFSPGLVFSDRPLYFAILRRFAVRRTTAGEPSPSEGYPRFLTAR